MTPSPSITLLPAQQAVVDARTGLIYVVAAAGSGKSTTAVVRIATIGDAAGSVLLAYNRDAAADLAGKLQRLGAHAAQPSTLHAWCLRALRRIYPHWISSVRIVGTQGAPSAPEMVYGVFRELGWPDDDWKGAYDAYGICREAVAAGVPLAEALPRALQVKTCAAVDVDRYHDFFAKYEERKRRARAIDFCDMAAVVLAAVAEHGPGWVASTLAPGIRQLVMDEAQDANEARWAIFQALADVVVARGGSALAIGDPRQSINGFTGARPELFEERLRQGEGGAEGDADCRGEAQGPPLVLHLPVTLRSTQRIVALGNEITADSGYPPTEPRADAPEGEWPTVEGYDSLSEEVQGLAQSIRADYPQGCAPQQASVLGRTHSLLAGVECGLLLAGISVVRRDGTSGVWSTKPGLQLRAYLEHRETGVVSFDLLEIANRPKRFLKHRALVQLLKAHGGSCALDVLERSDDGAIAHLGKDLRSLAELPFSEAVDCAVNYLGRHVQRGKALQKRTVAHDDMLALYRVLGDALRAAGSVQAATGAPDATRGSPWRVSIGTIHSAKGLEYDSVYIPGVSVGVLPHKKATDAEEERRLLYVAVTRARHRVRLSWAEKRSPLLRGLQSVRER